MVSSEGDKDGIYGVVLSAPQICFDPPDLGVVGDRAPSWLAAAELSWSFGSSSKRCTQTLPRRRPNLADIWFKLPVLIIEGVIYLFIFIFFSTVCVFGEFVMFILHNLRAQKDV